MYKKWAKNKICNTQTNDNHWITGSWFGIGAYIQNVAGLNMLAAVADLEIFISGDPILSRFSDSLYKQPNFFSQKGGPGTLSPPKSASEQDPNPPRYLGQWYNSTTKERTIKISWKA